MMFLFVFWPWTFRLELYIHSFHYMLVGFYTHVRARAQQTRTKARYFLTVIVMPYHVSAIYFLYQVPGKYL